MKGMGDMGLRSWARRGMGLWSCSPIMHRLRPKLKLRVISIMLLDIVGQQVQQTTAGCVCW